MSSHRGELTGPEDPWSYQACTCTVDGLTNWDIANGTWSHGLGMTMVAPIYSSCWRHHGQVADEGDSLRPWTGAAQILRVWHAMRFARVDILKTCSLWSMHHGSMAKYAGKHRFFLEQKVCVSGSSTGPGSECWMLLDFPLLKSME